MNKSQDIWERADKRISHHIKIHIQSVYSSLKTAEKKAANFLLLYPDKAVASTISEVAALAGCSEATLVRIARRLGFEGYPEMRTALMRGPMEEEMLYKGITGQDSDADIVRGVFTASMQAIEDSLRMLDMNAYREAVIAIKNTQKILLTGSGDAAAVALSGYLKFIRIGIEAQFSEDFDVQLIHASRLQKKDVVIAISHSGRTRTVIDVCKRAKAGNATVIAITNYPVSPIARISDILLLTASFSENTLGEIMTKRIPELCIIESMYISLSRHTAERTDRFLEQTNKALLTNKA